MKCMKTELLAGVLFVAMCTSAMAAGELDSGSASSKSLTEVPSVIDAVYFQGDDYAWPVDADCGDCLSALQDGSVYVLYFASMEGVNRIPLSYDSSVGAFLFPSNIDIEFGDDKEVWLELMPDQGKSQVPSKADEEGAEVESGSTLSPLSLQPGVQATPASDSPSPLSKDHPLPKGPLSEPDFVGPVIYCGCRTVCHMVSMNRPSEPGMTGLPYSTSAFDPYIPFSDCHGRTTWVWGDYQVSCNRRPYFSYSYEDCAPRP